MPYFALRNLDTHQVVVVFSQTMTALQRDWLNNPDKGPHELITKRSFVREQEALDFATRGGANSTYKAPINPAHQQAAQEREHHKHMEGVRERADADQAAEATAEVDQAKGTVADRAGEADVRNQKKPEPKTSVHADAQTPVGDRIRENMIGPAAEVREVFENSGYIQDPHLRDLTNKTATSLGGETSPTPNTSLDAEKVEVDQKSKSALDSLRSDWQAFNVERAPSERLKLTEWAKTVNPAGLTNDKRLALLSLLRSASAPSAPSAPTTPTTNTPTARSVPSDHVRARMDADIAARRAHLDKLRTEQQNRSAIERGLGVSPTRPVTEPVRPAFPGARSITISGTGHRPDKMFDPAWFSHPSRVQNPANLIPGIRIVEEQLQQRLAEHGHVRVVVGMAQGFDTLLARAAMNLKDKGANITLVAALPYERHGESWSRMNFPLGNYWDWHQATLHAADEVHIVSKLRDPDNKGEIVAALNRRNTFMMQQSHLVLSYWNGTTGGTYNAIKDARELNVPVQNLYKEITSATRSQFAAPDKRSSDLILEKNRTTGVVTTRSAAIPSGQEPFERSSSYRFERFVAAEAYTQKKFDSYAEALAYAQKNGGDVKDYQSNRYVVRHPIPNQTIPYGPTVPYARADRRVFHTKEEWDEYTRKSPRVGAGDPGIQTIQGIAYNTNQTTPKPSVLDSPTPRTPDREDEQSRTLHHEFENQKGLKRVPIAPEDRTLRGMSEPQRLVQYTQEFGFSDYGKAKQLRDKINSQIEHLDPLARRKWAWINPVMEGSRKTGWQVSWRTFDTVQNIENRNPLHDDMPDEPDDEARRRADYERERKRKDRNYQLSEERRQARYQRSAERHQARLEARRQATQLRTEANTSTAPPSLLENSSTIERSFVRNAPPQSVLAPDVRRSFPDAPDIDRLEPEDPRVPDPAPTATRGGRSRPRVEPVNPVRARRPRSAVGSALAGMPMPAPVQVVKTPLYTPVAPPPPITRWEGHARAVVGFTGRGVWGGLGQAVAGVALGQLFTPAAERNQDTRDAFQIAAEGAMSNLASANPITGRSMVRSHLSRMSREELNATIVGLGAGTVMAPLASSAVERMVTGRFGAGRGTIAGFAAGAAAWASVEVVKSVYLALRGRSQQLQATDQAIVEGNLAGSVSAERAESDLANEAVDLVFTDEEGDPIDIDFDGEQFGDIFNAYDEDGEELPFEMLSASPDDVNFG